MKLLKPLEIKSARFASGPQTNERPHWVQPKLVAQIKFTEWTADGKLRHPVYLGLRDDKKPEDSSASRSDCGSRRSRLHATVQVPVRKAEPAEPRTKERGGTRPGAGP